MPSTLRTQQPPTTPHRAARPWPRAAMLAATVALVAGAVGCDSNGGATPPAEPPIDTEGLRRCRPANGSLSLNEEIQSFAGCQVLEGSLTVYDEVTDLSPLASLVVIEGNLSGGGYRFQPLPLDALGELEGVGGDLHFFEDNVTSFQGLVKLRLVGGWLRLDDVPELEDLRGLERVRSLSRLTIDSNPKLRTLDGLDGLEQVTGNVVITKNPLLPSGEVDAFLARVKVTGTIQR